MSGTMCTWHRTGTVPCGAHWFAGTVGGAVRVVGVRSLCSAALATIAVGAFIAAAVLASVAALGNDPDECAYRTGEGLAGERRRSYGKG